MGVLADLDLLVGDDLSGFNSEGLKDLVSRVHRGERTLAGISSRIARRAADIAADGDGAPAEDVLLGDGSVSAKTARRAARRGRTAKELPKLGGAVDSGAARPENVDAVGAASGRMRSVEDRAAFGELDGEIAVMAAKLPPESFKRWLANKEKLIKQDAGLDEFERQRAASHFGFKRLDDGMLRMWGLLDPEWSEILVKRLRAEARRIAKSRDCAVDDHIQAEALVAICKSDGGTGSGRGLAAQIVVLTDERTQRTGPHAGTVSETWSGQPVPPETVTRLSCDAVIQAVEFDGPGLPLRVGDRHRSATDAQRKALRGLYRTCPIDGDTPFDKCEVHHVVPWEPDRNNTDIENLLPISSYWHHLCHEGRWKLTINPDRSLQLHKPNGQLYRTIGPPIPLHRRQDE